MAESESAAEGGRRRAADIALGGSRPLDRGSFVPLYFQLAEVLKEKLETGAWSPGARFPSEREIGEEFGVSRTAIRPALDLLVGDGSIIRVRGSGTFVAPPKREVPVLGLLRAVAEPPDGLTIRVLSARQCAPDQTVSNSLQITGREAAVAHLTALLMVEEQPVCLVDSYSSANHVPWLLPAVQALQSGAEFPKPGKLGLSRASLSIECAFFGPWSASQLGVSVGDPTLLGRLVQYVAEKGSKRERPVEFARLIYRSDSTQLAVELD